MFAGLCGATTKIHGNNTTAGAILMACTRGAGSPRAAATVVWRVSVQVSQRRASPIMTSARLVAHASPPRPSRLPFEVLPPSARGSPWASCGVVLAISEAVQADDPNQLCYHITRTCFLLSQLIRTSTYQVHHHCYVQPSLQSLRPDYGTGALTTVVVQQRKHKVPR